METEKARILIVDDEPNIGDLLSRWLTAEGYECAVAENGETAVTLLENNHFDLVVSDIMMPGMSGMDLLTVAKTLFADIAVVMVTAVDDRKTAIMALDLGAYGYVIKPFDRNEILINVANALERRRLFLLSREYENELETKVKQRTKEVREREEEIVLRLISAAGYRDHETGTHIRRIGLYSALMAADLGWDAQAVDLVRLAASMHDLGKIGISDNILLKPGALTSEEFDVMKNHTLIGARILGGSDIALLQLAKEIALSHHERWDGSGYPQGLVTDSIPQSARIVSVADVYDALVHDRVYRPALPEDEALAIMDQQKGKYFDPRVFDSFMRMLPELRGIREEVREEFSAPGLVDSLSAGVS